MSEDQHHQPQQQAMDVDTPASSGTLKRCSSAPMINDNVPAGGSNPTASTSRDHQPFNLFGGQTRTRRFSASFSSVPGSPVSNLRTPRINQLLQEEHADISNLREVAHEKEIHHTMQISQSWEDLSLINDPNAEKNQKMAPLHVSLPAYTSICNSPSPTRGFQSPTRRSIFRRSASPQLRPSPLGKRRHEDDKLDLHMSPRAKRIPSFNSADRGGLLTTTSNSLPGSLSSVGTPESLSSADSPGFSFRNVDSPSPSRAPPPEPMIVAKQDHDMTESPS